MTEFFTATMITLFVNFSGPVHIVSEVSYSSMKECEAHKRQKEYTERMTDKGFHVYLCEYQ